MIFRKEILGADKQDEEQEKVQLNLSTDLPMKTTSGTIWDMFLWHHHKLDSNPTQWKDLQCIQTRTTHTRFSRLLHLHSECQESLSRQPCSRLWAIHYFPSHRQRPWDDHLMYHLHTVRRHHSTLARTQHFILRVRYRKGFLNGRKTYPTFYNVWIKILKFFERRTSSCAMKPIFITVLDNFVLSSAGWTQMIVLGNSEQFNEQLFK